LLINLANAIVAECRFCDAVADISVVAGYKKIILI